MKTADRAVCAFTAGYLIKILDEREICYLCVSRLEHMESASDTTTKYDHLYTSSLGKINGKKCHQGQR